jgi:3-oxoacyl-[acyl-carrier protein] reductase
VACAGARVVALSSFTGVYAEPRLGGYAATKADLASLVDRFDLRESAAGVVAAAISPAYVDTDMAVWVHDEVPPDRCSLSVT